MASSGTATFRLQFELQVSGQVLLQLVSGPQSRGGAPLAEKLAEKLKAAPIPEERVLLRDGLLTPAWIWFLEPPERGVVNVALINGPVEDPLDGRDTAGLEGVAPTVLIELLLDVIARSGFAISSWNRW